MNILICDDKRDEALGIERIIKASGFQADVVVLDSGADVLSYIRSQAAVDVCFLDILMPEMNGVALAAELRANGYEGEIVFITFSNEFAAQSYQVNAFSYLLKPPDAESVADILRRITESRKAGDTGGIMIKAGSMSKFVLFRDISHVEVIRHKVYFRMLDGSEEEAYTTLSEILPLLLGDRRFAQCHRSFVVNMNAISAVQSNEIRLKHGIKIPISRSYSDFKRQYLNWSLDRL